MDTDRLHELGLTLRETPHGTEAELELSAVPLINPITRTAIEKVGFAVVGERLVAIDPPELVGTSPVVIAGLEGGDDLEEQLAAAFSDQLFHLQRRSAELQALGLEAHTDPRTLELSTQVEDQGVSCRILADRRGHFRVASATRDGRPLEPREGHDFELSEFRDRAALAGYLRAFLEEPAAAPPAERPSPAPAARPLRFEELVRKLGAGALVPPTSAVEVLMELRAKGQTYRFAAARIAGRTFRGLLATHDGKVWAERFELDDFPGVRMLVAELLDVPVEQVEMLGVEEEAK